MYTIISATKTDIHGSYAEPPVGDRRLRPSEPVQPWKETIEATRGVICPQHPPRFTPPHLERSEDCLVVNIWTPATATPKSKLPVLVFIHGGAFYVGSGLDNYANPHNLTQVRLSMVYSCNKLTIFFRTTLYLLTLIIVSDIWDFWRTQRWHVKIQRSLATLVCSINATHSIG